MPVKRERSIENEQVVADAKGLSSRAGTALVVGVADRVGLTAALSEALADLRQRRSRHDPGRVVRDLALTLADGGDCLSDLRVLRDQPPLFGAVASDSTAGGCSRRSTRGGSGRCMRRGPGPAPARGSGGRRVRRGG